MKKLILAIIILALITFLLSFTSAHNWFRSSASFEGSPLETQSTLTNSSFTQEKLDQVTAYIKDNAATTGMIVLEHGKVVYNYGDTDNLSYIASCRKSILSMLYGTYVDNGTIDLNETIGSIGIDDVGGLLPIEKQATVDHIITARSGVFHLPANGGYDERNVKPRGTMIPGEYFLYNNWDFNVAGTILEMKSGKSVYENIEEQLAVPLGFQDWNIENQKRTINEEKSEHSAYHIHVSTRDMAKIGQLMLQKGEWNGKQLISKDWVKRITTTVTPTDTVNKRYGLDRSSPVQFSYGYMWWMFENFYDNPDFEGAYTASGYAGHFITVIPKRNMVIAHKTRMDLLTVTGYSQRSMTSDAQYYLILKALMQN